MVSSNPQFLKTFNSQDDVGRKLISRKDEDGIILKLGKYLKT